MLGKFKLAPVRPSPGNEIVPSSGLRERDRSYPRGSHPAGTNQTKTGSMK